MAPQLERERRSINISGGTHGIVVLPQLVALNCCGSFVCRNLVLRSQASNMCERILGRGISSMQMGIMQ